MIYVDLLLYLNDWCTFRNWYFKMYVVTFTPSGYKHIHIDTSQLKTRVYSFIILQQPGWSGPFYITTCFFFLQHEHPKAQPRSAFLGLISNALPVAYLLHHSLQWRRCLGARNTEWKSSWIKYKIHPSIPSMHIKMSIICQAVVRRDPEMGLISQRSQFLVTTF